MVPFFKGFKKPLINKRLEKIRAGNESERDKFIREYIPFVIKTTSDYLNRYIESENSDEYSIAIEAFNEAIDKYNPSKGSFISFARLVIHSRLKDFFRKKNKNKQIILFSQLEENTDKVQKSCHIEDFVDSLTIKEEIKQLEFKLSQFNITLMDLVKQSPKHQSTRVRAIGIAKHIVRKDELKESLLRKKMLPSSKLIKDLNVSYKILKRSRKFIIATVLILDSNLELLKNYISETERGAANGL